jgi:hypothetical protein
MGITTFAVAVVFALRSPFDEQHQRRLFVLRSDNVRDFVLPWNSFWGKPIFSGLGALTRPKCFAIDRSPPTNDTFMSGLLMARLDSNNSSTALPPILVWRVRKQFKKICTTGMETGTTYTRFRL